MLQGFLNKRELAEFHGSGVTRRYAPSEPKGDRGQSQTIGSIVSRALLRSGDLSVEQKVVAIEGEPHQGMTWAAQEAYEEVVKADPPWKEAVALSAERAAGAMLLIAGWRPVYRALRSRGVEVPGTSGLRILAGLVPLAFMGLFVVVLYLAVAYARTTEIVYLPLLAVLVLGALGWRLASSTVRKRMAGRLSAVLGDTALDKGAAAAVGRALGSRLVRTQSVMALIVDDYHRLPLPAREAIIQAFREQRLESAVTWIVFDSSPEHLFRADVARIGASGESAVTVTSYSLRVPTSAGAAHR